MVCVTGPLDRHAHMLKSQPYCQQLLLAATFYLARTRSLVTGVTVLQKYQITRDQLYIC